MDKGAEIPKPRFVKAKSVLAAFSLAMSLGAIPACSEPASDNLPPVLELEVGDQIPVVTGVIRPTEDINLRTTPSVINPVGSNMGNLDPKNKLNKGVEYEVKNAPIVIGYDVTMADKEDNGNLWLRIFDTKKQEYRYVSMFALQGMFEIESENEIIVSKLDDQGNIFMKGPDGQFIQISGSLSSTDQ